MKCRPLLFAILSSNILWGQTQGKIVSVVNAQQLIGKTILGAGSCSDRMALLAYNKSGQFEIVRGSIDSLAIFVPPQAVAVYLGSGGFKKDPMVTRCNGIWFSTMDWPSLHRTAEVFYLDNGSSIPKSLVKKGGTILIDSGALANVFSTTIPAVSPDGTYEVYWIVATPINTGVPVSGLWVRKGQTFSLLWQRPASMNDIQDLPIVATDSKEVFLAVTNKDGSLSYLKVDAQGTSSLIWNWTDSLFGEKVSGQLTPSVNLPPIARYSASGMRLATADLKTRLLEPSNYTGGQFPYSMAGSGGWNSYFGVLTTANLGENGFFHSISICETGVCSLFEHSEALRYGWFPLALSNGALFTTSVLSSYPDGYMKDEVGGVFLIRWPIVETVGQASANRVKLNGKNLNIWGDPVVRIAGVTAQVESSSANEIVTIIPDGLAGDTTLQVFLETITAQPRNSTLLVHRLRRSRPPLSSCQLAELRPSPGQLRAT